MKNYLTTALTLVCIVLVVFLVLMKRNDNTQHENDAGTIADFSNQLSSAQMQVAFFRGTILTLSNRLDDCQSLALTFSNRLRETESALALNAEQITNLNRRVMEMESENQALDRQVTELTNQVGGLTTQLSSTQTNLVQANRDYVLLENRLRQDVGERLVAERKFNNPAELQAQLQNLKKNPAKVISADGIYAGLDVQVTSNGFHVLAPR